LHAEEGCLSQLDSQALLSSVLRLLRGKKESTVCSIYVFDCLKYNLENFPKVTGATTFSDYSKEIRGSIYRQYLAPVISLSKVFPNQDESLFLGELKVQLEKIELTW
jgi:hypothetical protein